MSGSKRDILDLNPPRGTRDFSPENFRAREWLFAHWRAASQSHGFQEYDAPILENEALYIRKSGEDVTQQLYSFEDKGGRRVALRPEMTPSLARIVMRNRNSINFPIKWFSIPQCWRYERMTRGRRREHFQWNVDIWGVHGLQAEVELLSVMTSFLSRVGLTSCQVGIKINNRNLLQEILEEAKVPHESFAEVCILVDKMDKVPLDDLKDQFNDLGIGHATLENLTSLFSARDLEDLLRTMPKSRALLELKDLFNLIREYELEDWVEFDPSVVRGLAYYTGTVFEAFDRAGRLRAICGGGRYNKLLGTFGGSDIPAVGFGFGDAVVLELLREENLLPDFSSSISLDVVIAPFSPNERPLAVRVAKSLRDAGIRTDSVLEDRKLKWTLKHADRLGAPFVVLVTPEEASKGCVVLKALEHGIQSTVRIEELPEVFRERESNREAY